MNTRLTAAIVAGSLAAMPHALLAANARQKVDACVKAFVATLGERYDSATKLRATRYPQEEISAFGVTELRLTATNPKAGQKFVAEASCTVAANGEVLALQTERYAAL